MLIKVHPADMVDYSMYINSDYIVLVEPGLPEYKAYYTTITLMNGEKYKVKETPSEISEQLYNK